MQKRFKISLLLNGGLLAVLLYQFSRSHEALVAGGPQVSMTNARSTIAGEMASDVPPIKIEEKPSFSWSADVEASDYPTYISNLRRIGCPQKTVRDIIVADLDAVYSPQRESIKQKLRNDSLLSRRRVEEELQELQNREAAQLASLLGDASATAQAGSPPGFQSSEPIVMPMLFQPVDFSALNLDSGQAKAIEDLRQQFVAEIGGLNQDPNDPAYVDRWTKAQPEYDALMQGMIGANAYQSYELAARSQMEQTPPQGR